MKPMRPSELVAAVERASLRLVGQKLEHLRENDMPANRGVCSLSPQVPRPLITLLCVGGLSASDCMGV